MDDSWIKKYLSSPLQSTSFSSSVNASTSFTEFDKMNLQNFTPLNLQLPSPMKNAQQMGRTPLSRNCNIHKEKCRKRPFAPVGNDMETECSVSNVKSPKTPRHAVKILKKIAYEDRSPCYLVQWSCGIAEEKGPLTTWEWADRLSPKCKKLAADFEATIADPQKAWEFTDYEVEAILDRTVQGELRYLVKWVGWRVPTWEKVKYLLPDYRGLVEEFEKLNAEDIQFWTDAKKTEQLNNSKEELERPEEPSECNESFQSELPPLGQKFPTASAPTAAVVVKAIKVVNKLDRNKENASFLMLWPAEAGVRSEETPNRSWERRISLGNVEAILSFEEAVRKRRAWAKQAILYEVEKVLCRRRKCSEAPQYLVKWKGYDEISWATMESLQICFKHLLVAYALERPRTLEKGRMEANEIRQKNITEETKAQLVNINERLNAKLISDGFSAH